MTVLLDFVLSALPLLLMTMMIVITTMFSVIGRISEACRKNAQYSKFWKAGGDIGKKTKISSRVGMFFVYSPALATALVSFAIREFSFAG